MLFNSYIFIFLFLPVCLLGYFLINRTGKYKLAQVFLLAMSLWFYGYFNYTYIILIAASMLVNYGISLMMEKLPGFKKAEFALGLIFNIGLLGYYKYCDFFIENVNWIFKANFNLKNILLPLGISFFTLQQISYIVDRYWEVAPLYNPIDYFCYVAYFPQLIAGPIVSHDELIPQFQDESKKKFNFENFSKGIYMFVIGLSKKVLLADIFGIAVEYGYAIPDKLNSTEAIFVMLAYTIQLYFDFSGYSDMAIGLGEMFNLELPINFRSPYKSLTIKEYWDRWHITLTRFFTKYIYTPVIMSGVRRGKKKLYAVITPLIVFLVSGFWHGANWTFVIWGLAHGIFVTLVTNKKKFFDKLHPAFNWFLTFGFVNVMLVLFRAENFKTAGIMLKNIFSWNFGAINANLLESFRTFEIKKVLVLFHLETYFPYITMAGYYVVAMFIIMCCKNSYEKMTEFKPKVSNFIGTMFLFIWSVFSLSGLSTFLYFNF